MNPRPGTIDLWCDGSGTQRGNPGGWAYLLRTVDADGVLHEREDSDGLPDATNNRAELTAAIEGLRAITRPATVRVFCDSEYVCKGFTQGRVAKWRENGWRTTAKGRPPVANRDLWEQLAAEAVRHAIQWHHVRGHAGVEMNERVDELAGAARLAVAA